MTARPPARASARALAPLFVVFMACALMRAGASLAAPAFPWSPEDAPGFAPEHVAALEALAVDARAVVPLAGLSMGVLANDAVFRGAWGFAGDAPRRDVTLRSTYRVASITKSFTAILAMQLAREGVVDLDADVRRYVPSFPAKPWSISSRALLTHTSGIGHYRSPRDAMTRAPMTTLQSLALFQDRELAFEPGARFMYSSFGYNLLGAALERAANQRFGDLLEDRVFRPLGMSDTHLEAGAREARDVDGFRLRADKLVKSERIDISSRFASGGARSTVDDILRFGRALLRRELVDEATWRVMTTPTVTRDGRQADYGVGFSVYPLRGHNVVSHGGGQPETSSLLLLVPEHDIVIVLLTNVEGQGSELHRLAAAILEVLVDGGTPHRAPYSDDVAHELMYEGMRRIFSYGLAADATASSSNAAVGAAFASLASLLKPASLRADPERARSAIIDAYHPAFGRVTPRVGAEMTRVLLAHGADRHALRKAGPLAFFSAYADACAKDEASFVARADTGLAAETIEAGRATRVTGARHCVHALPAFLVDEVERVAAAWGQTPPALLHLRPERVGEHLDAIRVLIGRPMHPSFRDDLKRAAARFKNERRTEEAQQATALAAALYPPARAKKSK